MKRYHIIKCGKLIAATATKAAAIEYIRIQQARETHYIRSEYGYIYGEDICVEYEK